MDELFGAPVSSIAFVLAIAFAFVVAALVYIFIRDNVLVRMAMRNVVRRPLRGVLVVVGLMLATAIISSAFTTGDSVTHSIKLNATESLRSLDEVVRFDEDSELWQDRALPEEFAESVYQDIAPQLTAATDIIDGAAPILAQSTAVINQGSRQFEVDALLTGLEPASAATFESLTDTQGNPVDLAALAPGEVYLDSEGADALEAQAGDTIGLALGPGLLTDLQVRAVVDGWYYKQSTTNVVVMTSLSHAQELLGKPGLISTILISNKGDYFEGEALTDDVVDRFNELPALKEAGLELFGVKQEIVGIANEIGNIFVSLFTTFGLFSIGVGLLLIFLMFTMLAAERKSEMGIARAVGMQRRHLIRTFMAEGAFYSLGSAVVGTLIGVGLGYLIVVVVGEIFGSSASTADFNFDPHVEATSMLVSFFLGSVLTFITVIFASWRISKLNIVRAIRDIPDPRFSRASRSTLFWGLVITILGVVVLLISWNADHLTGFGVGVSMIPVGIALILRWRGVGQRWVLTGTGIVLLVWWLLPASVTDSMKEQWNEDLSIFFVSGALLVAGAVLVIVNNSPIVLRLLSASLGRSMSFAPIVKSAAAYPLRYGFRTGVSVAMFAVVIFSVTVMSILLAGFDKLWEDQERFAGNYNVLAFAGNDLNPIADLSARVEADPNLSIVERENGQPQVGTFRTDYQATAHLSATPDAESDDTVLTGVDDDFVASGSFPFSLTTAKYVTESGIDHQALWNDLRDEPNLAVVNALLVPTRNDSAFAPPFDGFTLEGVEGLYIENDVIEPVQITVQHLKSNTSFELTIVGVLDEFASQGQLILPPGVFTSSNTLGAVLPEDVTATQFFFNTAPDAADVDQQIEAALFEHGLQTIDLQEAIADAQAQQRAFFDLVLGFMTLGLVVGIVALGVISARAVVERRHEIGVMRAIGYSRGMVQLNFLGESSFIAILGIAVGLGLGILTSVNVAADIRTDEPSFQFVIPWAKVVLIAVGAYIFSLLTTFLPSRQAAAIAPAQALRYE